ncbi:MAG: hypothetical protein ABWY83_06995 [Actinomycetota bacterium]
MSEHTKLFERAAARYEPPDLSVDRLLKRRDRKRRNQRITAGVVGIAVFVGLVWIVTSGLSFDRTQTPAVPGGAETGPAVTGQSGTGDFYSEDFSGLPPEGAVASSPVEGEVVADFAKIHVGFVYVYADGRVIWMRDGTGSIYEQRLTPEGVDLVLSGDVKPRTFLDAWFGPDAVGLPAGAWADPTVRAYVPPRYAICYTDKDGNLVDPSGVVDFLLPSEAEALLRAKERTYDHNAGLGGSISPATCFEVTIDEARALDDILSNATRQIDILRHRAFERYVCCGPGNALTFHPTGGIKELGQPPEWHGQPSSIMFNLLLPQGEWLAWGG